MTTIKNQQGRLRRGSRPKVNVVAMLIDAAQLGCGWGYFRGRITRCDVNRSSAARNRHRR